MALDRNRNINNNRNIYNSKLSNLETDSNRYPASIKRAKDFSTNSAESLLKFIGTGFEFNRTTLNLSESERKKLISIALFIEQQQQFRAKAKKGKLNNENTRTRSDLCSRRC